MLVSNGYPGSYETGKPIQFPTKPIADTHVFHAGTGAARGNVVTNGGRVLACSAIDPNPENALKKSYSLAEAIEFEGKSMRTDIGQDVI